MTILLKLLYTDIRLKFLQPVHVATKASTNFYTRTPFFFLFSFLSKLKLSHIIIKQKSTDEEEQTIRPQGQSETCFAIKKKIIRKIRSKLF